MAFGSSDEWFEREQLHFAAQDGDLEKVRILVEQGYGVNAFDELSKTPLHYAAENGHIAVMELLLRSGADVNARDEQRIGDTVLAEVAGNCSLEVATVLIRAGADPTIPGWMRLTALSRAATRKRGDGPAVYELLKEAAERRRA